MKAGALHPWWTIPNAPSKKIESCADAEHQAGVDVRKDLPHEQVLPGSADAHPHNIRVELIDAGNKLQFFVSSQIAKWRRIGSDDINPRILTEKSRRKLFGHARLAAVEEM